MPKMFEKLMAALKSKPGTNEVLDKIIGMFVFIVFFSMVYMAGLGDSRTSVKAELSNLARLDAKIDLLQKTIESDHECSPSRHESNQRNKGQ